MLSERSAVDFDCNSGGSNGDDDNDLIWTK